MIVAHTQQVANYPTSCDNGITAITSNPSINELGEVAFQGNLRRLSSDSACATSDRNPRQGVFLGGRATDHDRAFLQPAGWRLHLRVPRRRHVGEQLR